MSGQNPLAGRVSESLEDPVKASQLSTPDDMLITSSPRAKKKGKQNILTMPSGNLRIDTRNKFASFRYM